MSGTLLYPDIVGGEQPASFLDILSTTGKGTSDYISFKTGSQLEAMHIDTSGNVTIAGTLTVTGGMSGGSGGTNSVTTFGAIGDGTTDDTVAIQAALDDAFPANSPATAEVYFPPGIYKITSPLTAANWHGGHVRGAGRFASQIINTAGGNVLTTNGCQYTNFSDLRFTCTGGTGICIDLDWDGSGGTTALQSNNFFNMFFDGGATGVRMGQSGNMGSENSFFGCYWIGFTVDGLHAVGFNALQNGVFGGNFQANNVAIRSTNGSINAIINVGFQESTDYDIRNPGAGFNTCSIIGCRSESSNFYHDSGLGTNTVFSCHQTAATRGIFADLTNSGIYLIAGCMFDGQINIGNNSKVTFQNCRPQSTVAGDWLALLDPTIMNVFPGGVRIELDCIDGILSDFNQDTDANAQITKERRYTTDQSTMTTKTYTLA